MDTYIHIIYDGITCDDINCNKKNARYVKTYNSINDNDLTIKDIHLDILYDNIDVPDTSYDTDTDSIHNIHNLDNYYYTINGKLGLSNDLIFNVTDTNLDTNLDTISYNHIHIICHRKQLGGKGNPILDIIGLLFSFIFTPIEAIGNVFLFLIDLVVWLGKFIYWFIMFVLWLLLDLLNPVNFTSDFFKSVMLIIYTLFTSVLNIFIALTSKIINTFGGWMQGFWGWDQSSLTKNDKNSNYFKSIDKSKGSKCYLTDTNTVPFSVILGTVLCPPIGVFMELGLAGWLNIVICGLLTLLFYLPGLCYALLIIYA